MARFIISAISQKLLLTFMIQLTDMFYIIKKKEKLSRDSLYIAILDIKISLSIFPIQISDFVCSNNLMFQSSECGLNFHIYSP